MPAGRETTRPVTEPTPCNVTTRRCCPAGGVATGDAGAVAGAVEVGAGPVDAGAGPASITGAGLGAGGAGAGFGVVVAQPETKRTIQLRCMKA